ncbi:MAG: UDP-3-O-[3-hydroxymyristoyl] glucosamine N-acyltransferase [Phycisphaerales bacterium]|nr:UDP-3-O-[3-hydroxymyristoyl] glucosamine N-acyltransferase [Phycisphaerales bacterium]
MTVDELAKEIGAEVAGDGAQQITSASTLEDAQAGQVSFLANAKYAKQIETTNATAVIVAPSIVTNKQITLLKSSDPYYAFMKAVVSLHGYRKHPHDGIHPAAHVDETASVGAGTTIYPGAYIGPRAKLGSDCIIYPNVTIYDDSVIGDRCIIHAGSSIGTDGYGYATHQGVHHKIPQVGNVIIEDDVEIGACCSVERAAVGSTVIGAGTKIDQLVVVGHGCKIGPHCLLVAQTGIAGSATLGHHVTLAGQTGVAGHLKIGNQVTVGAQSGIISDIGDQSTVVGSPAMQVSHARRVYMLFTQLPDIVERIKTLEQQMEELGTGGNETEGGDDGAEVV